LEFLYKPRNRLINLRATVLEEVLVRSLIDPNRRDRPAGGCGELFSHLERCDGVTSAMTDQDRTANVRRRRDYRQVMALLNSPWSITAPRGGFLQ
jgi:hypothetical protein